MRVEEATLEHYKRVFPNLSEEVRALLERRARKLTKVKKVTKHGQPNSAKGRRVSTN